MKLHWLQQKACKSLNLCFTDALQFNSHTFMTEMQSDKVYLRRGGGFIHSGVSYRTWHHFMALHSQTAWIYLTIIVAINCNACIFVGITYMILQYPSELWKNLQNAQITTFMLVRQGSYTSRWHYKQGFNMWQRDFLTWHIFWFENTSGKWFYLNLAQQKNHSGDILHESTHETVSASSFGLLGLYMHVCYHCDCHKFSV